MNRRAGVSLLLVERMRWMGNAARMGGLSVTYRVDLDTRRSQIEFET
jgi:hypothetical protein